MKSLPLILVLPVLFLVGVACSSGPTEADIEATVQARVDATAITQPTAEAAATAAPANTPVPLKKPSMSTSPNRKEVISIVQGHYENMITDGHLECEPVEYVDGYSLHGSWTVADTTRKIWHVHRMDLETGAVHKWDFDETTGVVTNTEIVGSCFLALEPSWSPMTILTERMTIQVDASQVEDHLLYEIENPNESLGFVNFYIVGIDESGYRLSQDIRGPSNGGANDYHWSVQVYVPAKSKAFHRVSIAYNFGHEPPDKWEVALEETNRKWSSDEITMVEVDNGVITGGNAWHRLEKGPGTHTQSVDPRNNEFFNIDGGTIANKTENPIIIMATCTTTSPQPENIPTFKKFPEYVNDQVVWVHYIEINPRTKIVSREAGAALEPLLEGGSLPRTTTCDSWEVFGSMNYQ